MKRFGIILIMLLIFCGARAVGEQAAPEALARLRSADEADWAGGDLVLVKTNKSGGDLISMADGRTVLKNVDCVEPYGDKIFVMTADCRWYLAGPGGETEEIPCEDCDRILSAVHGIIVYQTTKGTVGIWDLSKGQEVELPEDFSVTAEYDPVSGRVWIFDFRSGFYRDDGTRMLPDADEICVNADIKHITDGRVAVMRGDTAEVFDLKEEKITASYPGYSWRHYDGQCQIFDDHTALLDHGSYGDLPSIIGDLYGNILFRADHGFIQDRFADGLGYFWNKEVPDEPYVPRCFYEISTGDLWEILISETEEQYHFDYLNPRTGEIVDDVYFRQDAPPQDEARAALYPPHRESKIIWPDEQDPFYTIYTPEGELLGHREWSGIDEGLIDMTGDGIGRKHKIDLQGWCAVMDFSGKWGIVATDHHMILPLEFDEKSPGSGSAAIRWREGLGFIARRDGQWYIFDTDGRLIY